MIDDLDSHFQRACEKGDFREARLMAEIGADMGKRDARSCHALFGAIKPIAHGWPESQRHLDWFVAAGLGLNDQTSIGTPMHQVALSGTSRISHRHQDGIQQFLVQAVNDYGADMTAIRYDPYRRGASSVLEDFVDTSHALTPVVRTALALTDGQMDASQRRQLARRWLGGAAAGQGFRNNQNDWFSAGIDLSDISADSAQRAGQAHVKAAYHQWQNHNPAMTTANCRSKADLLTGKVVDEYSGFFSTKYGSPLMNPKTWDNMGRLLRGLAEAGDPLTRDDLLRPVVGGKNMLQVAAEHSLRPVSLLEALADYDIHLKAEDLVTRDGRPSQTLHSLMETKAGIPALFRQLNWMEDGEQTKLAVFKALPVGCRSLVPDPRPQAQGWRVLVGERDSGLER